MPRDPKDSQLDEYVSPRLLGYLGAAKVLLSRSGWYTNKAKMLIIWVLGYYQIPVVGEYIPSIEIWLALLFLFAVAVMAWEYLVMWPAQIIFQNVHQEQDGRSPVMDRLSDMQDQLDRLEEQD